MTLLQFYSFSINLNKATNKLVHVWNIENWKTPTILGDLKLKLPPRPCLNNNRPAVIYQFNFVLCCFPVFEQYQKARTQFVQTVAELASRPQNIEILQNAGVMSLLRPLLLDIVPTIQQTSALALGRLANYNDDLAEAVVKGDILPQLVYSLAEQNVSWDALVSFALLNNLNVLQGHTLLIVL